MCGVLITVGQVYDKRHDEGQIVCRVGRLDVVVANQRKPLWCEIGSSQPAVLDIAAVNQLGTRPVRRSLRSTPAIRAWSDHAPGVTKERSQQRAVAAWMSPSRTGQHLRWPRVYGPYVVKRSTVRAAGPGTLSQLFSGSKPAAGGVMITHLDPA